MHPEPSLPAVAYALPDERRFFGPEYASLACGSAVAAAAVRRSDAGRAGAAHSAYAAQIGVGPDNSYRNTCLLLGSGAPIRAVIVVGFAGGLVSALRPGAVVVAESVLDRRAGAVRWPNADLLAAARAVGRIPAVGGPIVTEDHVLVRPAAKRDLAGSTGAVAVDMESAGAAAAAEQSGVPWIAVRVITDGVDDELPFDFNAPEFKAPSDPFGGVDRGAIVRRVLINPGKIPDLIRLGMRSSLAARRLAAFLSEFLPRIGDCR